MGLVDPSGTVVEDTRLAVAATQLLKPGSCPLCPQSHPSVHHRLEVKMEG